MSKYKSTALIALSLLALLSIVLILTPSTPAAAQAAYQSSTPTPDPLAGTPADWEVPFGLGLVGALSSASCLCCLGGGIPLLIALFVLVMYLTKLERD
jgi:hypothetical protein